MPLSPVGPPFSRFTFWTDTAWAKAFTESTVSINFLNSTVTYGYNGPLQPISSSTGFGSYGGCYNNLGPGATCKVSFTGTQDTTGTLPASFDTVGMSGSVLSTPVPQVAGRKFPSHRKVVVDSFDGSTQDVDQSVKRRRALLENNPPRNSRLGTHPDDEQGAAAVAPFPCVGERLVPTNGRSTPAQTGIYRVDPEFSEDARKARFQGIVVLMIEVGTDGRAHNPKIIENPGLGLHQEGDRSRPTMAFPPCAKRRPPLVSTARVEVHFHLM
jgi:hypothetical protein